MRCLASVVFVASMRHVADLSRHHSSSSFELILQKIYFVPQVLGLLLKLRILLLNQCGALSMPRVQALLVTVIVELLLRGHS